MTQGLILALRLRVSDELEPDHHPPAAHVAQAWKLRRDFLHALDQIAPGSARVRHQPGLDEIEGDHGGSGRDWIATKRCAVRADRPGVEFFLEQCGADGVARRQALGQDDDVGRLHRLMLEGEEFAGPQNSNPLMAFRKVLRRWPNAAFTTVRKA